MLLGLALKVLLAAAIAGAMVVYVSGKITRSKLREKAQENGIKEALIQEIDYCDNVVKLKDLDSDKELEVHGDDIDLDLDEDDVIYA